jgi:hypothetical protein
MERLLNKAGWLAAGVLALFVVAAFSGVVRSGPLDPSGPPAATSGVRPLGTAIESLPYTITQPGNYYLTGNLYAPTGDGILISADAVFLNLNGFDLRGSNTATGIRPTGGHSSFTIENGSITGWFIGFDNSFGLAGRLHNLMFTGNSLGARLKFQTVLEDCVMHSNDTGAIADRSEVRGCLFLENGNGVSATTGSVVEGNHFAVSGFGGSPPGASIVVNSGVTVKDNEFSIAGPGIDLQIDSPNAVVIRNTFSACGKVVVGVGGPPYLPLPPAVDANYYRTATGACP